MRYVGLDPSTKTGFVALDENGNTLRAKELTGIGNKDPKRMATLVQDIMSHLKADDVVCIEGFSYGSQGQGVAFQYGLGYAVRLGLYHRKIDFIEVTPGQLKKYATGKGNTQKDDMVRPIKETWNFTHSSDNVLDAYVLAQIAKGLKEDRTEVLIHDFCPYHLEVLEAIENPKPKPKPKKKKVKK